MDRQTRVEVPPFKKGEFTVHSNHRAILLQSLPVEVYRGFGEEAPMDSQTLDSTATMQLYRIMSSHQHKQRMSRHINTWTDDIANSTMSFQSFLTKK